MPCYCFTTADGETVEQFFSMADVPPSVELDDGRIAERDFSAEHAPRCAGGGWPMVCCASGVHESQAQELRDFFKVNSCPTEVTNDGDPIYRDAQHRKRALKLRGMYDRASY